MKFLCVLLGGIAVAGSCYASTPAPGILVRAMNGRTVVFEGLTDGRGRFQTGPLQPGIYTFELRVPKNIITPAQYSLVLGGARPISDAVSTPKTALTMEAEVRSTAAVRGQVTARRVNIVPAQTTTGTTSSPTPPPVARGRTTAAPAATPARAFGPPPAAAPAPGAAAAAPQMSTFSPRPMTNQPRMINGRPHIWVPITAGANLGRWMPAPSRNR